MVPYYRKFHTYHQATPETIKQLSLDSYMNVNSQGPGGSLAVTILENTTSSPFNAAWLQIFHNLGFGDANDPISGEKLGPFTPPCSIDPRSNTRSYAASAYLNTKVSSRSNLEVVTETLVEKVVLEEQNGSVTAKGVQVWSKSGGRKQYFADEVILSAGTIQSPQILELSGIGSRNILEANGIPLIVESSGVGGNLQDHPFAAVSFEVADGQASGDVVRNPEIVTTLLK